MSWLTRTITVRAETHSSHPQPHQPAPIPTCAHRQTWLHTQICTHIQPPALSRTSVSLAVRQCGTSTADRRGNIACVISNDGMELISFDHGHPCTNVEIKAIHLYTTKENSHFTLFFHSFIYRPLCYSFYTPDSRGSVWAKIWPGPGPDLGRINPSSAGWDQPQSWLLSQYPFQSSVPFSLRSRWLSALSSLILFNGRGRGGILKYKFAPWIPSPSPAGFHQSMFPCTGINMSYVGPLIWTQEERDGNRKQIKSFSF